MDDLKYVRWPPQLLAIRERTAKLRFPMASEPLVGAMELGTGTGVATAWLLDGMDDGATLVSVDNDAKVQQAAKDILGQDGWLTLVTGGGSEFSRSRSARSFDLVFADAMQGRSQCENPSRSNRSLAVAARN